MAPAGFCGEATEIFHEGLRVPPVKIKKAGKDVDDVWRLLLANCARRATTTATSAP